MTLQPSHGAHGARMQTLFAGAGGPEKAMVDACLATSSSAKPPLVEDPGRSRSTVTGQYMCFAAGVQCRTGYQAEDFTKISSQQIKIVVLARGKLHP